ncbi:MAG TPA: Holliday junction branch migration protein RuvA [Clostridia bacterium]|nr:Holliday junction branch migration protein RuvA [Clostridia bacterium]
MLDFICGEIVEINGDKVVVENNGIGYMMTVSGNAARNFAVGEKAQLFTYLQVKQDGLALFGFYSKEEKNMFLQLITVNGVGPKMAVTILSGIKIMDLAVAIVNQDTRTLSSVKGLGKKTSERIVLELKEKMSEYEMCAMGNIKTDIGDEAVSVLRTLGISEYNATKKVQEAIENGAKTTEEILSHALKNY